MSGSNMLPIPAGDIGDTSVPETTSTKKLISTKAAQKAAEEAGLGIINAAGLKAAGVVGDFMAQVGAIQIGRARLAMNLARAERAMDFIEEVAKSTVEPDVMADLMKVNADLLGKSNSAAELLIKSAQQAAEVAKVSANPAVVGFAPRVPAGLTQVNVTVSGEKSITVKHATPASQSQPAGGDSGEIEES